MAMNKPLTTDGVVTKNKGEVSEFYSFVYILGNGAIDLVDGNLQSTNHQIEFLKLIRSGAVGAQVYDIYSDKHTIDVHSISGIKHVNQEIVSNYCKDLLGLINGPLKKIPANSPEIVQLLSLLETSSITAKAQNRSDFLGSVQLSQIPGIHTLGFSVKSQLGVPATLLNANKSHSAFQYEVTNGDGTPLSIQDHQYFLDLNNSLKSSSWVKDRLHAVYTAGKVLRFNSVLGANLEFNLTMIDTLSSEILGALLLENYKKTAKGTVTLENLVEHISKPEILKKYPKLQSLSTSPRNVKQMLLYKVKRILCAFATGATVSSQWDGLDKANGGIVIVLKDGKVVCLELFTRDALMQYLISSTKFEGPSSTRHPYGCFYSQDGKLYFDLQLQIRFCE